MIYRWMPGVLGALALAGMAQAQHAGPVQSPAAPPTASAGRTAAVACCTVPSGTLLDLQLADALSSKTQKRGDRFALRLGSPVVVDGITVLPAGVEGVGEIVDAAPSRMGGAPGKLLLAGRYLTWNGAQIPLRGLKTGGTGKDHSQASAGVSLAIGILGLAVHGGNIEMPAGMHVEAKIAEDTFLSPAPVASTDVAIAPALASPAPTAPAGTIPVAPVSTSAVSYPTPAPVPPIPDTPTHQE